MAETLKMKDKNQKLECLLRSTGSETSEISPQAIPLRRRTRWSPLVPNNVTIPNPCHQPMSTTQPDENPSPGACTEREVTVNTQRFRFIPRVVERKLAVDKRQTGTTVVISYQPMPQTQQDGNRCLVTPMQQTAKRPIAERCLIEPKRVPVPKKKRCLVIPDRLP
ncbi:uncharacterized protein LOC133391913 [Anopheles gambiae]|uniref:uncharacterized protein LOC133391913 n=1 Tax=Anopheles gambiae TaxID=7165 RepID=UPI002AC91424|nr:uncharacterized protein LOC133391913 [Anopheles gambiae]